MLSRTRDSLCAEEVTVEVFAKILSRIDAYDPNKPFRSWILTIAHRTLIDVWRKQGEPMERLEDHLPDLKLGDSPEELLIAQQDEQYFLGILAELETNYRKIIELRFLEELSIREIARELNITESNAKVRIMRAKKVLAELLKKKNYDE